ncbi:MAG: hypothetical protein S0880_32055 [Actinomycetota bacterium]|nr:hypothetical protein [Actinomycetota bacterium]
MLDATLLDADIRPVVDRRPPPEPVRGKAPPVPRAAAALAGLGRRAVATVQALVRHECRHLVMPLAALTAVSSLTTLGFPLLVRWPILLVAGSPRLVFMVLAARVTPIVPFVLIAAIRLCIADPFNFLLGRRIGSTVVSRIPWPRVRAALEGSRRFQQVAAALAVLARPSAAMLMWAGSQRVPPPVVAVCAVTSTLVYCVMVHRGMTWLGA